MTSKAAISGAEGEDANLPVLQPRNVQLTVAHVTDVQLAFTFNEAELSSEFQARLRLLGIDPVHGNISSRHAHLSSLAQVKAGASNAQLRAKSNGQLLAKVYAVQHYQAGFGSFLSRWMPGKGFGGFSDEAKADIRGISRPDVLGDEDDGDEASGQNGWLDSLRHALARKASSPDSALPVHPADAALASYGLGADVTTQTTYTLTSLCAGKGYHVRIVPGVLVIRALATDGQGGDEAGDPESRPPANEVYWDAPGPTSVLLRTLTVDEEADRLAAAAARVDRVKESEAAYLARRQAVRIVSSPASTSTVGKTAPPAAEGSASAPGSSPGRGMAAMQARLSSMAL